MAPQHSGCVRLALGAFFYLSFQPVTAQLVTGVFVSFLSFLFFLVVHAPQSNSSACRRIWRVAVRDSLHSDVPNADGGKDAGRLFLPLPGLLRSLLKPHQPAFLVALLNTCLLCPYASDRPPARANVTMKHSNVPASRTFRATL